MHDVEMVVIWRDKETDELMAAPDPAQVHHKNSVCKDGGRLVWDIQLDGDVEIEFEPQDGEKGGPFEDPDKDPNGKAKYKFEGPGKFSTLQARDVSAYWKYTVKWKDQQLDPAVKT